MCLFIFVISRYKVYTDFMPGKHHVLSFVVGLFWGAFLESNATSSLGINLKVDVNGKTVVDKSIPNGKLCYTRHFLFHMINTCRN